MPRVVTNPPKLAVVYFGNTTSTPKLTFGGGVSGAIGGAGSGAMFGPAGLAIGALTGMIGGAISSGRRKKELEEEQARLAKERLEQERTLQQEYFKGVLATYPSKGVAGVSYYMGGGHLPVVGTPKPMQGRVVTNVTAYPHGGTLYATPYDFTIGNKPVPHQTTPAVKPATMEKGGVLLPLASDASIVKGDTHNQDTNRDGKTGVMLKDDAGQDMAEVEHNEVIIGDKVFSARLGFAPAAKQLADKKAELEKGYNKTGSTFRYNTIKREVEKVDNAVDRLFTQQETVKQSFGLVNPDGTAGFGDTLRNLFRKDGYIPGTGGVDSHGNFSPGIAAKGMGAVRPGWGIAGNIASAVTPFIDNIVNRNLIKNAPQVPKPLLNKAVPFQTDIEVAPQLQELENTKRAYNTSIDNNVSNSAVGNAAKAGMFANLTLQKNKILGDEINKETELKNLNAANIQSTNFANTAALNQYNTDVVARRLKLDTARSENASNLTPDIVNVQNNAARKALDLKKMQLMTKANSLDNDAALANSMEELIQSGAFTDGEELFNIARQSKRGLELYSRYFPDSPFLKQ